MNTKKVINKKITKKMIREGYNKGVIKLITNEDADGVVCQIGDNWFFFGGLEAELYNDAKQYAEDMRENEILRDIYEVLQEFKNLEDFYDEYLYYYFILVENGIK